MVMQTVAKIRFHYCIDIASSIKHAKELKGCSVVDGKRFVTVEEARSYLKEQFLLNRRFLPMGACDNFDYLTGCKGHEKVRS